MQGGQERRRGSECRRGAEETSARELVFIFYNTVLPDGSIWDVVYNPTKVTLRILAEYEADFDEDGDVDSDDYYACQAGFGMTGSAVHADGDADADGDVDGADFLTWQQQFGSNSNPSSAWTTGVPEPGTVQLVLSLIAMAVIADVCRIRR